MSIDDCCICHIFNKKLKPINVIMLAFKIKRCLISVYCLHPQWRQSAYQHKRTGIGALENICLVCFSHSWSGDSTSHAASVSRAKVVMSSYRSAPPHCSISSPWTAQTQTDAEQRLPRTRRLCTYTRARRHETQFLNHYGMTKIHNTFDQGKASIVR